MKKLTFTKMCGAGNDFIIINASSGLNVKKLAQKICHRTDGIGADGLMILDKSRKADYKMRIINADGSEAEMCGNGARCMAAYILKTKTIKKKQFSLETKAGIVLAEKKGELISVRLSDPENYTQDIAIAINTRTLHLSYIDTGVPHVICFVDGLEKIDVNALSPEIRFHEKFQPRGTNVNFVEQINKNLVAVRTYERGVEAETRACGTGSVACAIVAFLKANSKIDSKTKATMKVKTASGEILSVCFNLNEDQITNVWLTGSARFIADGNFYIN
ncbi:MAG: diaminopimelate epimerase [Candidatus Omnitrophica bacterium]|nr:diaminopimelate epimerase [Candidatus Omnitrophota bacterium]